MKKRKKTGQWKIPACPITCLAVWVLILGYIPLYCQANWNFIPERRENQPNYIAESGWIFSLSLKTLNFRKVSCKGSNWNLMPTQWCLWSTQRNMQMVSSIFFKQSLWTRAFSSMWSGFFDTRFQKSTLHWLTSQTIFLQRSLGSSKIKEILECHLQGNPDVS